MHDLLLRLAAEAGQTVVLVTHDLMEAVTLADRVLVCTRRPATIALEQRIDLAPRDVLNVRFTNASRNFTTPLGAAARRIPGGAGVTPRAPPRRPRRGKSARARESARLMLCQAVLGA